MSFSQRLPSTAQEFLPALRAGLRSCHAGPAHLLVGVSGGADSVALLCGLHELRGEFELRLTAAHFNHQLRGDDSHADAQWTARLADRLGVPLVSAAADVRRLAGDSAQGIEEAARRLRYEFLAEAARRHDCACLALAHTADDQAETILHHILRGTGLAGLSGMPRRRPLQDSVMLIRPLLDVPRQCVRAYLEAISQDFRRDASNEDPAFTRNRLRNALLPLIRREFNPQVDAALLRLGSQAAEVQQLLDELADRLLRAAVLEATGTVSRLKCSVLADEPRHLVRQCFVRLWSQLGWPRQRMGAAEWDRLADLVVRPGRITLPEGIEARRRGDVLLLRLR